jgi:hypothetical protein
LESVGSGSVDQYFDYGAVCINLTVKAETGNRREKRE